MMNSVNDFLIFFKKTEFKNFCNYSAKKIEKLHFFLDKVFCKKLNFQSRIQGTFFLTHSAQCHKVKKIQKYIDNIVCYDILDYNIEPYFKFKKEKKCQKKLAKRTILAWKLPSDICAELIDYLKDILFPPDFVNRHKNSPKDFTRNRKLPFQTLFLFLTNFIKGSCQDELDHHFKSLFKLDAAVSFVTKMAFSLARKKIKYTAFIEMNRHLTEFFETHFKKRKTWNGFNLPAVDGSGQKLFKFRNIIDHFGTMKPQKGSERPMARISQLFDVLNKVAVDAVICPYRIGERELLRRHLINLLPNDLLLLDRGYPAYWVFNLILSQGGSFCAGISRQWKAVQASADSGEKEKIIDLNASYSSKAECIETGLDVRPLKLRLIRLNLTPEKSRFLSLPSLMIKHILIKFLKICITNAGRLRRIIFL